MQVSGIRIGKITPTFEAKLEKLKSTGKYNTRAFERTLCAELKCNYGALKAFMNELASNERYEPVAIYYMEHSGPTNQMIDEFKAAVSKAYGIVDYQAPNRDEAKGLYWAKFFGSDSPKN